MTAAVSLRDVNVGEVFTGFSDALVRDGNVYISRRDTPFLVHTPPLRLAGPLATADGETEDFVLLKPKAAALELFKTVEAQAMAMAFENKSTWFREDISDETIMASFKSFVDGENGVIRVRVSESLVMYDAAKNLIEGSHPVQGARVKAVLELARITFGKTQFGLVWTLRQIKVADVPATYLFDDDESPATAAAPIAETLEDNVLVALSPDDDDLADDLP